MSGSLKDASACNRLPTHQYDLSDAEFKNRFWDLETIRGFVAEHLFDDCYVKQTATGMSFFFETPTDRMAFIEMLIYVKKDHEFVFPNWNGVSEDVEEFVEALEGETEIVIKMPLARIRIRDQTDAFQFVLAWKGTYADFSDPAVRTQYY